MILIINRVILIFEKLYRLSFQYWRIFDVGDSQGWKLKIEQFDQLSAGSKAEVGLKTLRVLLAEVYFFAIA